MIDFEKLSPAEKIIAIGKLIYDKGYNAGKDGNISVRLNSNRILITASGAFRKVACERYGCKKR